MVRAANELGLQTKLFGGGMVGLQFASLQTSLGPMLNGIVNYDFWVPEPTLDFPGIEELLAKYQERAEGQGVDPLGHYLPPFAYAYLQVLGEAVDAVGSLDQAALAEHIHKTTFETVVGPVKFGANGEWAKIAGPDGPVPEHRGRTISSSSSTPASESSSYPRNGSPASSSFPTPKPRRDSARAGRGPRRPGGRWTCS